MAASLGGLGGQARSGGTPGPALAPPAHHLIIHLPTFQSPSPPLIYHNHPTTSLPSTTSSAATAGSCTHSTHLSFSPKRSPKSYTMKGALLTAAVLLGSAQAATHKLKLKKVPLAEQLVCASIPERCHNRMLTIVNAGDDAYRCPGSASRSEVYGCSTSDAHGCCLQRHAG